jgi:hypothetical protein
MLKGYSYQYGNQKLMQSSIVIKPGMTKGEGIVAAKPEG